MKYRYINIDNLKEIQDAVIAVVPDRFKIRHMLGFAGTLDESRELFVNLPPLREALHKLNIEKHVLTVGIISTPGNCETHIHVDSGPFKLSLNIPIQYCDNTNVKLYHSDKEPLNYSNGQNNSHIYIDSDCVLDEIVETNKPYILNTQEPHRVSNPVLGKVRIMLLIRLLDNIRFDHFKDLG